MKAASRLSLGRLSPLQKGLLAVVILLTLTTEIVILDAYFNIAASTATYEQAGDVTTNLANVQREALRLQIEANRLLSGPGRDFTPLDLRRALLANQLQVVVNQIAGNARIEPALDEIQKTLAEFDALLVEFKASPSSEPASKSQFDEVLDRLEGQIKTLYDREEILFFETTSHSLRAQRTFQIALLGVSVLIMVFSIMLVFSLGRTVSSEFERTYHSLEESNERFRTLAEATFEGIIIHEQGQILEINQALAGMFNYETSEIIGQSFLQLIQPKGRELTQQYILAQDEKSYESIGLKKDGSTFDIEIVSRRFPYQGRSVCVAAIRDITERKQVAEALAQARDHALEASRLKTQLLAKVSHELRTPLGAILGFSEMLQEGVYGPISSEQREIATEIIDSTQYLTGMVNELLDQAQIELGRLKLNNRFFTPANLVKATLAKMSVLAQAKGLSLSADIAPELPTTLCGDPDRLQQLLVNLVSNAIKFTQAGTVQVRFYCPDPGRWVMEVADTGPGIPLEAQSYIFEPFRQIDGSVTRVHTGTGLGLSIVKQLVMLMEGQVALDSELGQGSIFTVCLPLVPVQEKIV